MQQTTHSSTTLRLQVSQKAQWCLSFGQNHLYFDTRGRFLGTLGDENGAWESRALNVPYTAVDVDEEYPR